MLQLCEKVAYFLPSFLGSIFRLKKAMHIDIDDIFDILDDFFHSEFGQSLMAALFSAGILAAFKKNRMEFYHPGTKEPMEVPFSLSETEFEALRDLISEKNEQGSMPSQKAENVLQRYIYQPTKRIEDSDSDPHFTISIAHINRFDGPFAKIDQIRAGVFRAVFAAIEQEIKNGTLINLSYYTLDMPYKNEAGEWQYVRLKRYREKAEIFFHVLGDYKLQPMFPRLYLEKDSRIEPTEMPDHLRQKVTISFCRYFQKQKHPFTPKQREVLRYIQAEPDISAEQIANKMHITQDSVRGYLKDIAKTGLQLFEVIFQPRKGVAQYWREMGLYLPE